VTLEHELKVRTYIHELEFKKNLLIRKGWFSE
jgi:hypothetical protein